MTVLTTLKTCFSTLQQQATGNLNPSRCRPLPHTSPPTGHHVGTCVPGLDTLIILDRSGSMGYSDYRPNRLEGGKRAAIEFVNQRAALCPDDWVGVIAFDHTVEVKLKLTSISDKQRIVRAIGAIKVEGGTNLAVGLKAALELFKKHHSANTRQIILLTDGHGGSPLRNAATLKDELGCIIDVVGIGGAPTDVNEKLLRKVSTTDANGVNHYRFINDSHELKDHYRKIATGIMWKPKP